MEIFILWLLVFVLLVALVGALGEHMRSGKKTCSRCGIQYEGESCPRCRYCFKCKEWYEGDHCPKCFRDELVIEREIGYKTENEEYAATHHLWICAYCETLNEGGETVKSSDLHGSGIKMSASRPCICCGKSGAKILGKGV